MTDRRPSHEHHEAIRSPAMCRYLKIRDLQRPTKARASSPNAIHSASDTMAAFHPNMDASRSRGDGGPTDRRTIVGGYIRGVSEEGDGMAQDLEEPRSETQEDFMPLMGIDHVEFYVGNARQAAFYYSRAFGFSITAYAGPETKVRDRASYVLEQGEARYVFTGAMAPESEIAQHEL